MSDLDRLRDAYIAYFKARYVYLNGDTETAKLGKYARVAWSRKLKTLKSHTTK